MDKFAALTGRQYNLFDYIGAPDATDVIVVMGSGALTVTSTVEHLVSEGEKVGLVIVRLFRPFDPVAMVNSLPPFRRADHRS
jgi:pyruvate-ferredoxin/flavodoxin oxidoreductase